MVCLRARYLIRIPCNLAKAGSEAQGRGGRKGAAKFPQTAPIYPPALILPGLQNPSTGPRGSSPRVSATSLGIAPLRTRSYKVRNRPYARYEHIYEAFFLDGGRLFFFFDEPPPFRRRWTKRNRTATKAAATKDAPMARWCFTMPVSSGTRGTSPASKSCAREHKYGIIGDAADARARSRSGRSAPLACTAATARCAASRATLRPRGGSSGRAWP